MLMKIRLRLQGKKSYILAGIGVLATIAFRFHWIDENALRLIYEATGCGWAFAMAAKVNRLAHHETPAEPSKT